MTESPPYSKTRLGAGLVFTAGHIGRTDEGVILESVEAQTLLALRNLENSLATCGLSRSDVVRTTVFLSDMSHWTAMNEPYRAFFNPPYPARSTVAAGLPNDVLVEIEAIATAHPEECA